MSYTNVTSAMCDADSPINETLMQGLRNRDDALLARARAANLLSVFDEFGGDGSDGALSVTGATNLDASTGKQYSSITIESGGTLTITAASDGIAKIGCSGDCVIEGAIVVNAIGGAGANGNNEVGAPGTGFLRNTIGASGGAGGKDVSAGNDGGAGGAVGATPGGITGAPGTAGTAAATGLSIACEASGVPAILLGPGAGGGEGGGSGTSYGGAGGDGGGCLILEVAGDLDFSGTITANGEAGENSGSWGGGGGGGGGTVSITAYTVSVSTGSFTTNGGAGGNGAGSEDGGAGGAGYSQLIELAVP